MIMAQQKASSPCNTCPMRQRFCTSTLVTLLLILTLATVPSAARITTVSTVTNHYKRTNSQKQEQNPDPYVLLSLSLLDLVSSYDDAKSQASNVLMEALTTTGIVAITDIDNKFAETRDNALSGLCECASSSNRDTFVSSIDNTDTAFMDDGLTTRTSFATATAVNGIPLPLPTEKIDSVCNGLNRGIRGNTINTSEQMETLRDYVSNVSEEFIRALDRMILTERRSATSNISKKDELLRSSNGKSYKSVRSIVSEANHLEHFHVYSKTKTEGDEEEMEDSLEGAIDSALTTHTDAGLFLSFVPAVSCHKSDDSSAGEDSSFVVWVDGTLRKAVFPSSGNSIVVMLGAGAQHWMKNMPEGLSLRATKHAVQMRGGVSRAWYGMMHLVPENAVIQDSPREATFADMRQSMLLRNPKRTFGNSAPSEHEDVVIGCGFDPDRHHRDDDNDREQKASSFSFARRRRLQMVPDASYCDNSTSFYCWMSCLDIPDQNNAAAHIENGESLYCAEQTTLGRGLSNSVRNCQDPVLRTSGSAMNTDCVGIWHPTVDEVLSQELNIPVSSSLEELPDELNITDSLSSDHVMNVPQSSSSNMEAGNEEEPYCFGGTSMFMNGFQWTSITCVIYLFPAWVLNTRGKLIGASIGTILFGISVEGIIQGRRILLGKFTEGKMKKLMLSTVLYGVQLTMSYMIMLVIMTYSGPLFFCTIIGLMAGHFIFQWLIVGENSTGEVEGSTPCCQNVVNPVARTKTSSSTGNSGINNSDESHTELDYSRLKLGEESNGFSKPIDEPNGCCHKK